MSNRKTKITIEDVKMFLIEKVNPSISNLKHLDGGELSCPFSFSIGKEEFVIRIDSKTLSYRKDEYAYKHFASPELPIPEMIQVGRYNETLHFAITRKVRGRTLDKLTDEEVYKIMPSIISTLDNIHSIDISDTKGYGYWDEDGKGLYSTWREYIGTVNKQNHEWGKNPKTEYLEILQKIYNKVQSLLEYCPEDRYLIHRDFGFNNALADDNKITGVIDWGESSYGDFAFDIAWLDTWQDTISFEEIFRKHYMQTKKNITRFYERILCYKLFIYYGSIIFFVQTGQSNEIEIIIPKINSLL